MLRDVSQAPHGAAGFDNRRGYRRLADRISKNKSEKDDDLRNLDLHFPTYPCYKDAVMRHTCRHV